MTGLAFWIFVAFVIYVYLGYPAVIALLARFRAATTWRLATLPSVTVLISAYQEQDAIGRKLENTLQLDYPSELLQILVAVDGTASPWSGLSSSRHRPAA